MAGRVTVSAVRAIVRDDINHSILNPFNETFYIHVIHLLMSYNLRTGIKLKKVMLDELSARLLR